MNVFAVGVSAVDEIDCAANRLNVVSVITVVYEDVVFGDTTATSPASIAGFP